MIRNEISLSSLKSLTFLLLMRFFVGLLTVLMLVCCLTCCGGKAIVRTDETEDTTALRIGVLPTMECLPLYVAAETGVFDSLGLNARLVTFEAAMDADTAFFRGHIDGVVSDLVKAVLWKSRGDSIRIALVADLHLYLITSRPARLKTGESLKEKIVAFTRNSALDYTADGMLAVSKLKSEQLNKPQINNILLRLQMLMNNQYDGAILPEPYATLAIAQGHNLVLSTQNLKHYNPLFTLVLHDTLMARRGDEVAKLAEAYDVASARIERSDSADAAQWLSYLPLTEAWPDSIVLLPVVSHVQMPADVVVDSVKQWLRGRGLLQRDVKCADLMKK